MRRFDRFEALFEIWRGSAGAVYMGRLRGPGGYDRIVVVKHFTACTGAEAIAAFRAELGPIEKINHPHAVSVYDHGEIEGAPYVALQLVWGGSLARILRGLGARGRALDPSLAAFIAYEAALGLREVHRVGAVHGDVSPSSLLIDMDGSPGEGRVKVTEFGVAKYRRAGRPPRAGVGRTKFAYLSPEQARGAPVDPRSDIFSLGIVLHEALTGRPLFAARSAAEMIRRVREEPAPHPRSIRPEVPAELAAIAQRCLEKDPRARYATAHEVAHALLFALAARRAGDRTEREVADTLSFGRPRPRPTPRKAELLASTAEILDEQRAALGRIANEIFGEELAVIGERTRVAME